MEKFTFSFSKENLNKKGYICNLIFHKMHVFRNVIKKSLKNEEISKYPKGRKTDWLGCAAEACSATQSSLYWASIKSAGKCSLCSQKGLKVNNGNWIWMQDLRGRNSIYKNDPWLIHVYIAHLPLTAHQLTIPSLFLPTFPQWAQKARNTRKNVFRKLSFL